MPRPMLSNGDQSGHDIRHSGAAAAQRVGTRGFLEDGRVFHYGMNTAATALDIGKLVVSAAITANHENIVVDTAGDLKAGTTSAVVTVASTVIANEYQEGYLCVTDGLGEAYFYRIQSHTGRTGTGTFTALLWDPIIVSAGGATTTTLVKNLWRDPVLSLTAQARVPVGIPSATIADGSSIPQYGWIQTWGFALGWDDEATAVGSGLTIGSATAGQIEAIDTIGEADLGWQIATGIIDQYQPKFLRIAP